LAEKGTISELKAAIYTLKALVLVQKAPVLNKKAANGQPKAAKHYKDILECFLFYTNVFNEEQVMDKFVTFFILESKPTLLFFRINSF